MTLPFLRKGILFSLILLLSTPTLMAQDKPAYQLFNSKGKKIRYGKMLKQMEEADVVLFGELHNNAIAHWLELEVFIDLTEQQGAENMRVGMEMLETHQQSQVDAYANGDLDRKSFEDSTQLWPNHDTDYRPVLAFAKENGIPIIATNVTRKYARQVSRAGQEDLLTLPEEEKALMTPLPYPIDFDLPSYVRMKEMISGHGGGMNAENFIAAQALKDATMGHFILQNWEAGRVFYHMNGSYHSDSKEGIAWYLTHSQPEIRIINLTVVEQDQVDEVEEEHLGKADFIIVVPNRMTPTYVSDFE